MTVDLMLGSAFPMFVAWGAELGFLYNDAYAEILGDKHPAALGQRFHDIWPEIWSDIDPLIQKALDGSSVFLEDLPLRVRRGGQLEDTWFTFSYSPVREGDGRVMGMFCCCVETTVAKRREVALRQSEEMFRALAQTVPNHVWRSQPNGQPNWFSDSFYDYLGVQPDNFDVNGWIHVIHPEDLTVAITAWSDLPDTGARYEVQVRLRRADGVYRHFLLRAEPVRDAQGQITQWIGSSTDVEYQMRQSSDLAQLNATLEDQVTQRTRALMKAEEALRQSQKMDAIGQLTGGVAHDFNNLLTVIKSSTELLKRPGLPEERRARYVAAIATTVDRAAKLTGQLLAFARRQSLKPEVFAACDSVRAVSEMMGTLAGSRIQIITELPEKKCMINADPSQFDTALVNMALNARDAMDGQGQLTIRVEPVEAMPAVRSHAQSEGPFVAISLTDTGEGIPPERLEQIFEPFFTTKGVGKGTGLGLSQVFGFAKQSGGEVVVSSKVGQGATFTLYLPRVQAPASEQAASVPEPLVDGHGTCVLVVEDNVDVGTFAVQTLSDLGYKPVLATNAQEALAELAKDANRFDVVFSDVVMPGMNGIDLAHEIRRQYHDLPVLLASGYSHVLAQNGTYGFELLHKPYSIEELSRLLRKVATWQRRKRILGQ